MAACGGQPNHPPTLLKTQLQSTCIRMCGVDKGGLWFSLLTALITCFFLYVPLNACALHQWDSPFCRAQSCCVG